MNFFFFLFEVVVLFVQYLVEVEKKKKDIWKYDLVMFDYEFEFENNYK